MKANLRTLFISLAVGIVATVMLKKVWLIAKDGGADLAAKVIFWPNSLYQSFFPPINEGTLEHPMYLIAPPGFLHPASYLLSAIFYAAVAFIILRYRRNTMSGIRKG